MTEWPWVKLWVADIADPQWIAVADLAGSTPAVAFYSHTFGQAHANRHDRKGGSVAGLRPQVIASFCRVAVEEIIRVFQAFRDLEIWVGDKIGNWSERQANPIRLATVDGEQVSDEASDAVTERRRYTAGKVARWRARKRAAEQAEKRRVAAAAAGQEWLALPVPWEGKPAEVTAKVTPVTSVTSVTAHPDGHRKPAKNQRLRAKHAEGYTPQEREEESLSLLLSKESDTARASAKAERNKGNPSGREAPLQDPVGNVVHIGDKPVAPRAPNQELRARKKEMRRQKVTRFVMVRFSGAELERRLSGLMGVGEHDEQWWFDFCDRERLAEDWDDMRDKERTGSWRQVG